MDSPAAVQMWAESVFWIIVISIIAGIFFTIFGTIIFSILETLISGRTDQKFILDERDKAISNTGNKITIGFMGAGFIILIVGIKFGYEIN